MKRYTVREVATRYAVGEDTVRRWIRGGRLQAINIATHERKVYRVTEAALQEFEGLDEFNENGTTVTAES